MVSDYRPGGHRRLDRVLDPGFSRGLGRRSRHELRSMGSLAREVAAELGWTLSQLSVRIAVIDHELARRDGADSQPPELGATSRGHGPGRRRVERLLASVTLSDVALRTADELRRVRSTFVAERLSVAGLHARVLVVAHRCEVAYTAKCQ